MEAYRKDYPITVLCETLGVSLSGSYAWKKRPSLVKISWKTANSQSTFKQVTMRIGRSMAVHVFMRNCASKEFSALADGWHDSCESADALLVVVSIGR